MNCPTDHPPLGPIPEAVVGVDGDLRIRAFNEGAEFLLGFAGSEVAGRGLSELVAERFRASLREELEELAEAGRARGVASRRLRLFLVRRDGGERPIDATFSWMEGAGDGWLTGVFQDLGPENRESAAGVGEGQLDPLTALADRRLFLERAEQALQRLQQHGRQAAVLLVDLNRFRLITNTLGQDGGDQLLSRAGQRLLSRLRPGDVVGRVGGDQFAVLLNDLASMDDIPALVMRLLGVFEQPFRVQGHELTVSVRVGASVFPDDGGTSEALLRGADMARSRAGMPANNHWAFYAPELEDQAWRRLELESRLKRALEQDEFRLVYQPIVELATNRLVAVEALLRWDRPGVGAVSPADFISLLEETGMIVPVGEWVVRTAARQLREWRDRGLDRLELSVNLSPRQLADSELEAMLAGILRETGLAPGDLRLEITESLFLRDLPGAEAILGRLREQGFGLSLDDFGTGYSALGYLRQLPFDRLKIDRSFIGDIPRTMEGTALVQGIIHMADTLGIRTVAEGVERQEQADVLRWLGSTEGQGFGFSPPVSGEQITRFGLGGPDWPIIPGGNGGGE